MSVRVRFAPSPTGFIHIGNIRTALFNYLFARHSGGKFILRIEDTDPERSKKEYADAIMRDLEAVGMHWDEGPFYQSERLALYQDHLKKLQDKGKVYLCFCTEEELAARRKEAMLLKKPPRYDNRCRTLTADEINQKKAQGIRPSIRFKVDEKSPVLVKDLIRGDVQFNPDELGDFVIMRSHPSKPGEFLPTFHMSVCVDDGLMNVSHVIRGEDHLSNSPRHVLLFRDMGYPVPQFAHLSLIHGKGGEPLSKRLASVHVKDFINTQGYLPNALLNYLALLGWSPKDNREVMDMETLIREFHLENATRHPAIFNEEKLDWINGEHLHQMPEKKYCEEAERFLAGIQGSAVAYLKDKPLLEKSLSLVRTDIKKFGDLTERLNFIPKPEAGKLPPDERNIFIPPESKKVLEAMLAGIDKLANVEGEALFDALSNEVKQSTGLKGKTIFMPLRVAVTGHLHGPELKKLFGIFSRDEIRARIQNAISFCTK